MAMQRISGLAAILAGLTYIAGFWVYFTILGPAQYGAADIPAERHVAFLVENEALMIAWNLVIYVLNAALMAVVVVGLYDRMRRGQEALSCLAAVFGLIWTGLILAAGMVFNVGVTRIVALADIDPAAAASLWHAVVTVGSGLGGGNEITGGLWIFFLSLAALLSKSLPLPVSGLGLAIGAAGIASTIPALAEAATLFGLGFILWFFAVGLVLCFTRRPDAASG